jgi:hypothetical protein
MFGTFELGTVLIETPLRNASGPYMKPYMVRLVLLSNSLAKFRVCLGIPPVVFPTLNLFDVCPLLTLEILLNKIFERACIRQDFRRPRLLLFVGSNRKQCEGFHIGNLGKLSPVKEPPRNVRIARGFLV